MSWNELSLKDKADYIKESVNNGIYNLSDIRNRYNMYANGGYTPSNKIKKDIANWEGSEMKRNVPFSEVTRQFNATIPASIRTKLSSNQLDALYSYGYNVGMGNLKKRVLPTLNNYVKGKATNEDVQRSMWASRDNELRGLTRRRNWEREMFGGNYRTIFTGTGGTPNNYSYSIKSNTNTKVNPYQIQNEEWQDKNYLAAYKGLQLSMNDIMGKTKEDDIDDLFSTGTGPTISMDNLLSIGNNTVAPVQPDYSYAKSLLSDFDSDLNSNMFGNGGKIPKTYQGDLSHLKDIGYQKWRANLPTNLREETSDYNLYEAYKSGAKPRLESDGYYHLPSRDPKTNKILKKPTHPTYGMALREDAIEGYLPIYKNGETYTYPLPWIKADGGKLNIFAEGGNMDNNRTAMPAHPATNPYKRRSWETDEEYKERIQDLDNKSQEAALNDSTAINKYKEWEANIQKQQKINEEKSKAITIEKNTKRAKTLEKEFNSLRNIPSQMSPNDTIQVINKNIPEAYKQQYINNINMYKPVLDTIDLGINLYSLYNPTVPVLSAGLLTNGLQFGQSIVDEDLGATDYSALTFDTLGLLGATNKLPTKLRIGKNRFWNIDKTADYLGVGQNILDSASDIYDLSKTGYHLYNNKGSNNLYISPFKKSFDEGGNLSYIDADNRRSNILLHTEDGNLYDSAGNNYTQSYLDEENVPVIKGTMPRNTRQYYDSNTTLDFINAATLGLLNRGSVSQDARLAKDIYNTMFGNMSYSDLINSATLGNKGIFNNPTYNTLLDFTVPITGYGVTKGLSSNYVRSRIASPFVKSALSANNFNKSLASSNYLLDNLSKMYPNLSEVELNAIYRNAFNKKDYLTGQLIRDLHYLNAAGDNAILNGTNPRVTYHGTEYGNFSVFDSSQSNATIGGSAATGEKGNFTTDDLKAALNYGKANPEYLYWGNREPITNSQFDKYIDVRNLRDWRGTKFLSHVGDDAQRVVYPLYITSNNPSKVWDFKGNPWSKYPNPDELGRKWELKVIHDFPMAESGKKNQGFTETFLDRKSLYDRIQQLKKEGYTVGEKEYEYDYTNHKKIATGWRGYRTGYWDNITNKRIHYPEIKAIDKVSSTRYKPTTNGIVQQSFEKGNDAVFINNVEDANAKDNWAINEIIFRNANQAKLANPFTVDDNNNLISILKRDNFLNPDIRYKNGGFLNNYLSLC